jgi:hypothetical protein
VNVDDLLVGNDRWRMASLVVESDGSVLMSVVPNAGSAICPVCVNGHEDLALAYFLCWP